MRGIIFVHRGQVIKRNDIFVAVPRVRFDKNDDHFHLRDPIDERKKFLTCIFNLNDVFVLQACAFLSRGEEGETRRRKKKERKVAICNTCKNETGSKNVACPKDQIADYDECGTHFHVPWSSSSRSRARILFSPSLCLSLWFGRDTRAHPVYT